MSLPKVAYVTAGGAGMFCGSCLRDNALAAALHRMGCPVTLIPTFTPIRTDETDMSLDRVFLGGINIYLEERWPILGRLPRVLRRGLSHPALLHTLSKLNMARRGDEEGPMAVSLLQGEDGHLAAEIRDLADFIAGELKPDVVNLTNLLIAGFVPALKKRRAIPVAVTLQGDDIFLDGLPPASREAVVREMRRVARHVDAFIVFTAEYRDRMAALLDIPLDRFRMVPLGVGHPEAFAVRPSLPDTGKDRPPVVGYLARVAPEKGFHHLVDAFLLLRTLPEMQDARLHVAGWLGPDNAAFFETQRRKLKAAGAGEALMHGEIPDHAAKVKFLQGLDVFSVPADHREPKGLYVLEALAAGVPVVQPRHAAFPELLASTGGGRLVPPGDAGALARELHALLTDERLRRHLGEEGRQGVAARHTDTIMTRRTLEVWQGMMDAAREPAGGAPASLADGETA